MEQSKLRKTQVLCLEGGIAVWRDREMQALKAGDFFRMFEPDGAEVKPLNSKSGVMLALSDAFPDPDGVPGVKADAQVSQTAITAFGSFYLISGDEVTELVSVSDVRQALGYPNLSKQDLLSTMTRPPNQATDEARLSAAEIQAASRCPEVLRALANWHSAQATEADAIGGFEGCVSHHDTRRKELEAIADRIEASY